MGEEWLDKDKLQECPIFYIRGFLPGRKPLVDAGGDQFKTTLQSESYFTRHGKIDPSSSHIREREKLFGLLITFAETDVEMYRVPTLWMPSWADITIMDDVAQPESDKLGFIGCTSGREDWYSQDKNNIILHKQTELHKDQVINTIRYAEAISKFKILVAPPGRYFNSMTGRVFEIMACRRMCLAYHNPDTMFRHDKLFIDGVDLVYWHTFEELEEKYRYYLAHPDEMWRIAENGYHKVRTYHNQDLAARFIAENTLKYANEAKSDLTPALQS
jgi:hypothetical protein